MNKSRLIEKIADDTGLSKRQVTDVLESIIEIITNELKNDGEVKISCFGTFLSRLRHARKGVNPQKPSEPITIPEVRVAKFKTGKALRDRLKE